MTIAVNEALRARVLARIDMSRFDQPSMYM